jgi:phospholipase C
MLVLSGRTALPTGGLAVNGTGFTSGDQVEVFFDKADLASVTVGSQGSFAARIAVPAGALSGPHWVSALDSALGTGAQAPVTIQASWPMAGNTLTRASFNPWENTLDPTTVATLSSIGTFQAGGALGASPIVIGNSTYVGGSEGVLYALHGCPVGSCQLTWRGTVGGHITGAPTFSAATVYVGSSNGSLEAFSAACGSRGDSCSPVWSASVGGSVSSSVAVAGGVVFVTASDGSLYAFAASGCGAPTCAPLWVTPTVSAVFSSPAVAGGVVYVGSTDGSLYAFAQSSGALVWKGATGGAIVSTPVVVGHTVYIGSKDGRFYAFATDCGSGGALCTPSWSVAVGAPIESTPAAAYNEIFVGADDGSIHAWSTFPCASPPCSPSWTGQTPAAVRTSLAVADGVLYASSVDGTLSAFTARGLSPIIQVAGSTAPLSSPAVANGGIYVGDGNGVLHIFGVGATGSGSAPPLSSLAVLGSPIRHVVVLFQENHSFDNVLGDICVLDRRCDGALTGQTASGTTIPLTQGSDLPPAVDHSVFAQQTAIDGGNMDGFSKINGCTAANSYQCYSYYSPGQIPNLAAVARQFVISDRTFELSTSPSFGGHIALAAGQLDGFTGDAPGTSTPSNPGWGCDSNLSAKWISPSGSVILQPACIPRPGGSGPYAPSQVASVPSIMGRLDQFGFTWRLYTGDFGSSTFGYSWAICPMFAACLYSADAKGMSPAAQVVTDANAGSLPSLSLVMPEPTNSQHNTRSMLAGDNWIGSVVSAIEAGPDWQSTAIFITYDDCGCFYDHVPPPAGLGIRVPMVIVSPYAKPSYTDSNVASFASMLAFTEHAFGVQPLGSTDASAYDYSASFDYTQPPTPRVRLRSSVVPPASLRYMKNHPPNPDDPT